jgi:uncharacterized membrane protein
MFFDGPGLPLSILFVAGAAVFVLRGPLGKALAERLAGRGRDDEQVRELRAELDDVRAELTSVHERLDFAERMIAKPRDPHAVGPGGV